MRTITALAKSRIRYNKSRTVLTGISILLTTMLLAALGTCAVGLWDANCRKARKLNNIHAMLYDLDAGQVELLGRHLDVESMETSMIFASVEYGKMNAYLGYGETVRDGITYEVGRITEGHMPAAADEICGPAAFFQRLGAEPVIGQRVTISFRPNQTGEIVTRDFTICGLTSERDLSGFSIDDSRLVYSASISGALADEYLPIEDRRYTASIRVSGEDGLSYDQISQKINDVAADAGCSEDNLSLNESYLHAVTDLGSEIIPFVTLITLLICFFAGLVIYSIYYVSVITDVQELGRLKALGASRKQIGRLLFTEGLGVCAFAIPAGLAIGYLLPRLLLPAVIDWMASLGPDPVSEIGPIRMFSLPVFALVIVTVLVTVCLALRRPVKIAARISPIEAIRYQESRAASRPHRGYQTMSLTRLSLANLTKNKKRTLVTILSMTCSCVLFLTLAGVLSSMRAEDIARRLIRTGDFALKIDYSRDDEVYPENNLNNLQKQNPLGEDLLQKLRTVEGITAIDHEYRVLAESDDPSPYFAQGRQTLSCFCRDDIDAFRDLLQSGSIDYDRMLAESGTLINLKSETMEAYGLSIGDTVDLTLLDGDRKLPLTVTITGNILDGASASLLIPQEIYEGLDFNCDTTCAIYIDATEEAYDSVKVYLKEISASEKYLDLYSMDEEMALNDMLIVIIRYPMYGILILIAVIGFMNLMNTMITSVITRKQELGIIQAIGLSDRQLTRMLSAESMFFTAGTLAGALTAGNLLGFLLFLYAKETGFMSLTAYHYPLWETLGMTVTLILGQLLLSRCLGIRIRRESLIERIRRTE